ncbi:glycerophosphodiester phosphodiesterase family protein [Seonamhaeicola sp. MEBiC1930]|uniref:glycerophosphodiester phosphodiesterase family protein n=1 Tax=Seonamhaeicola sp. MEBiC01930 TaxID=2976768 RepID=UPI003247E8D3
MKKSKTYLKIIFEYIFFGIILLFQISCNNVKQANDKFEEEQISVRTAIEKIKEESKNEILVCAHRGYHKNAPENSLESIKQAIEAKIDIVEIDIRTSKDNVLVLMHDDKLDRTTTGIGHIKDYTYQELKSLYLKIEDSITSHKIPTLSEALNLSKGRIILNLDLKDIKCLQLYRLLKEYEMEHEVFSFIWDKEMIQEMISIDSLYAVLPLSSTKSEMELHLEEYKSPLQHFTEESYTPKYMNWAHENGIEVFVNSLWDEDIEFIEGQTKTMDSLLVLDPSIIQTDHPKMLVDYLKSKGLHD